MTVRQKEVSRCAEGEEKGKGGGEGEKEQLTLAHVRQVFVCVLICVAVRVAFENVDLQLWRSSALRDEGTTAKE